MSNGSGLLDRGALPGSVRRLAGRARAHRWRSTRTYVTLAVLVVLLASAAVIVWGTSVFSVRSVTLRGAHSLSAQQVLTTAAVPHGANLARLDTDAIRTRVLAAYPAIGAVSVHRSYPSTVQITITERTVVATLHVSGGAYELVDRDGVPFRAVSKRATGYPLITVHAIVPDNPAIIAAAHVAEAMPAALRSTVLSISAPSADGILLRLTKSRTCFWGGSAETDQKYVVLATILKHPPSGGDSTIDVSSPGSVTVG